MTLKILSVPVINDGIPISFFCKTTIKDQSEGDNSVPGHFGLLSELDGNGMSNRASVEFSKTWRQVDEWSLMKMAPDANASKLAAIEIPSNRQSVSKTEN